MTVLEQDQSALIDVFNGHPCCRGARIARRHREQKKIFERCKGLFYGCDAGAQARRFNRLLIDAGLIKGL